MNLPSLSDVSRYSLTGKFPGHFTRRGESISSYAFIAGDGLLAIKDPLVALSKNIWENGWRSGAEAVKKLHLSDAFNAVGSHLKDFIMDPPDALLRMTIDPLVQYWPLMTNDTKSGIMFIGGSMAIRFARVAPTLAFRAAAGLCSVGIAYLTTSGIDMDQMTITSWEKVNSGLALIPGVALMGAQKEIGQLGNWLVHRKKTLFNRLAGNIARYPMIWAAGLNIYGMTTLTLLGLNKPADEWPMVAVGMICIYGNIGLLAMDPRIQARAQYAKFFKRARQLGNMKPRTPAIGGMAPAA